MQDRSTTTALRTSASVLALGSVLALLPAVPGVRAQQLPAGLSLTLEGGVPCAVGSGSFLESGTQNSFLFPPLADTRVGDDGCGSMGRIGLSQYQRNMLGGWIDSWGLFWREQRSAQDIAATADALLFNTFYQNVFNGETKEGRTVVDFEIGKDLGIGQTPGDLRLVGGIRYARFTSKSFFQGTYSEGARSTAFNGSAHEQFEGFGPRLGLTARVNLGSGFAVQLGGYGSALHGDRKSSISSVFQPFGFAPRTFANSTSDSGWLLNLEGEAALSYQIFRNAELQLGVRAESWSGRSDNLSVAAGGSTFQGSDCASTTDKQAGCSRLTGGDRVDVTPFARLNVKLGN